MAGDWIKMRAALLTHPKTIKMVNLLQQSGGFFNFVCQDGITGGELSGFDPSPKTVNDYVTRDALRYVTVSGLLALWSSARLHSDNGILRGLAIRDLDEMAGIPDFGDAMQAVGWAKYDRKTKAVVLPNFMEWNDQSHREPKSNAERQKEYRERHKNAPKKDRNESNESNDRAEQRRVEQRRVLEIPAKQKPTAGAFKEISEADLSNPKALRDWHQKQLLKSKPVVDPGEGALLNILCAAERAMQVGTNPMGLFANLVSGRKWDFITQEQEERARECLKSLRGPLAKVSPHATELAKQFAPKDS